MKQVIILSPRAHEAKIKTILKGLHIPVFSKIEMEGYRSEADQIDITNWFGAGKEADFSVMFFAFVKEACANDVLDAITKWNEENSGLLPLHAFQLPVDRVV
tara:strand:- start:3291 stop:3596 length:306 start_codon:yes stop_codon:yes gene_type:complete